MHPQPGSGIVSMQGNAEPKPGPESGKEGSMPSPDEMRRKIETLEDRVPKLSAAILRISVSLDVNTVLQEVVESACVLTGARYGVIMAADEMGQVQEYVAFGMDPERLPFGSRRPRDDWDWKSPFLWATGMSPFPGDWKIGNRLLYPLLTTWFRSSPLSGRSTQEPERAWERWNPAMASSVSTASTAG